MLVVLGGVEGESSELGAVEGEDADFASGDEHHDARAAVGDARCRCGGPVAPDFVGFVSPSRLATEPAPSSRLG